MDQSIHVENQNLDIWRQKNSVTITHGGDFVMMIESVHTCVKSIFLSFFNGKSAESSASNFHFTKMARNLNQTEKSSV